MTQDINMTLPENQLVRELDLTEAQWLMTANYWEGRVRVARNHRYTLLTLVLVVLTRICINVLALPNTQPSGLEGVINLVLNWTVPVFMIITVLLFAFGELVVVQLKRVVSMHIPASKLARVVKLGDEVAMHTLLCKKVATERKSLWRRTALASGERRQLDITRPWVGHLYRPAGRQAGYSHPPGGR